MKRVLCYGDSLTAGWYNGGRSFEPYARHLNIAGVSAVEVGLSGWCASEMVSSHDEPMLGIQHLLSTAQANGQPFDAVVIMCVCDRMLLHICTQQSVRVHACVAERVQRPQPSGHPPDLSPFPTRTQTRTGREQTTSAVSRAPPPPPSALTSASSTPSHARGE